MARHNVTQTVNQILAHGVTVEQINAAANIELDPYQDDSNQLVYEVHNRAAEGRVEQFARELSTIRYTGKNVAGYNLTPGEFATAITRYGSEEPGHIGEIIGADEYGRDIATFTTLAEVAAARIAAQREEANRVPTQEELDASRAAQEAKWAAFVAKVQGGETK